MDDYEDCDSSPSAASADEEQSEEEESVHDPILDSAWDTDKGEEQDEAPPLAVREYIENVEDSIGAPPRAEAKSENILNTIQKSKQYEMFEDSMYPEFSFSLSTNLNQGMRPKQDKLYRIQNKDVYLFNP